MRNAIIFICIALLASTLSAQVKRTIADYEKSKNTSMSKSVSKQDINSVPKSYKLKNLKKQNLKKQRMPSLSGSNGSLSRATSIPKTSSPSEMKMNNPISTPSSNKKLLLGIEARLSFLALQEDSAVKRRELRRVLELKKSINME